MVIIIDYICMTTGNPPEHYRGWFTIHPDLDDARSTQDSVGGRVFLRENKNGYTTMTEVKREEVPNGDETTET